MKGETKIIEEKEKIKFKDLTRPLQLGIVGGIIVVIFYSLFFVVGIISGLL